MRKKPYPITNLTGGLYSDRDPILIADPFSIQNQWVRFDKGIVKKEYSLAAKGSVTGTPMHFDKFVKAAGTTYYICITTSDLYTWNSGTGAWDSMGATLTGSVDIPIFATQLNDVFIFTNGVNAIQQFDGTTVSALGGTGAPDSCIALTTFRNRLVVANTTESSTKYPFRVRWTDVGTTNTWTGGTSGTQEALDGYDWATALTMLGETCWLFKENSIWEIVYIGGTGVFDIVRRIPNRGTKSAKSIAVYGDGCLFYGSDSVCDFDKQSAVPVSDPIFNILYKTEETVVDNSKISRMCGKYLPFLKEYWLAIPTIHATNKDLLKYSLVDKSWRRLTTQDISAFGDFVSPTTITWAAATGAWTTYTAKTWASISIPTSAPTLVIGRSTGYVWEDTRTTYGTETFIFETKDFIFGHAHRLVEIRVEAQLGAFTAYYSTDGGTSWSSGQAFAASAGWTEYVVYTNVTAQRIRCRITSTASQLEIRWIEPWYIERKRSVSLSTS